MLPHRERRDAPRSKTDSLAAVRFPKGAILACRVIDLSQSGARLAFDGVNMIPERFDVMIGAQQPRAARKRWRNGQEVGVAFE